MPQLNPEFFITQLFWLFITFTFLLLFLWKVSLPRISSVLEKRERKINDNIKSAKKLQTEAEEIQKNIDKKLKEAENNSERLIKESINDLQNKTSLEIKKIDEKIDEELKKSSKIIEKEKNKSLNQINSQIKEITKITLSKFRSINISDDEIDKTMNLIINKK